MVVEREVGGGASSEGLESTGATASSTKAALPAGDPPGQTETVAGQQDGGSFMAAAARMEWIERQGHNDGVVDMEVGDVGVYAGGSHVLCMWREGVEGVSIGQQRDAAQSS